MTTSARPLGRMLTADQLATETGWSKCRIGRLVNRNEIPHVRVGKSVFFEAAAIEQWLAAQRQGPQPRPMPDAAASLRHGRYRE